MKQAKSLTKNYLFSLAYQILTLITPFVTTPYVSRVLGANGIGISSYVSAVVFYFTLVAALGTATAGQREIAYYRDNKEHRSQAFWNAEILNIFSVIVACFIYAIFIDFQIDNQIYYKILFLNIITVAFDIVWFFQGIEEFQKIVVRNFIFKILGIVYLFLFVRTENDVDIYILGNALTTFLSAVSLWGYLPNYIQKINWEKLNIRRMFNQSLRLFIPTLAVSVYVVLDKIMLGAYTTDYVENGNYEQAMKIAKMSLMFIFSFAAVMTPRISYCFQRRELDEIYNYMMKSYRFVWMIGFPVCFGLWAISSNFVPWFFGPGFDGVVVLINILAILVPLQGLTIVSGGQYLVSIKEETHFTYSVIAGATTNIILNLCLIPRFYAIGASVSSIIGELMVVIVQFYYVNKHIAIKSVLLSSQKYFLAATSMLVLLLIEATWFIHSASIVNTVILILSGVFTYVIVLLWQKDDMIEEYLMKIRKKINFI